MVKIWILRKDSIYESDTVTLFIEETSWNYLKIIFKYSWKLVMVGLGGSFLHESKLLKDIHVWCKNKIIKYGWFIDCCLTPTLAIFQLRGVNKFIINLDILTTFRNKTYIVHIYKKSDFVQIKETLNWQNHMEQFTLINTGFC